MFRAFVRSGAFTSAGMREKVGSTRACLGYSGEGELAIVQACLYLATAPKSNAAYKAQKSAWATARDTGSLMPPLNIVNAPTRMMKDLGYGKGYAYDHDTEEGFSGANYWPDDMTPATFYAPLDRGFEAKIAERIAHWDRLRSSRD